MINEKIEKTDSHKLFISPSYYKSKVPITGYISGWCRYGFESLLQPFFADIPWPDKSLWLSVFSFHLWYGGFNRSTEGLLAWLFRL